MFSLNTSAKKIGAIALFPWLLAGFGYKAFAQETPKSDKKSETQEIIIKKKGDKDATLKLEFSDNKVLINGKPLIEFNDDEISINNRKVIINGKKIEQNVDDMLRNFDVFTDKDFKGNFNSEPKAFLGVTTTDDAKGAKINAVTVKSAASEAGLLKDDIITKIDKEAIKNPDALSKAILGKKPGDKIKITYLRNGKSKTANASLQKSSSNTVFSFSSPSQGYKSLTIPGRPMAPAVPFQDFKLFDQHGNVQNSFSFIKTPKMGIKIMDIETSNGVKVLDVEAGSLAATAGLQKEDILISMNNQKIDNTDMAREVMRDNVDVITYPVVVKRNGKEMTLTIKVPKEIKTIDL